MKHVSGKEMCKVLERKGWRLLRTKGAHYIYGTDNPRERTTVPVHANQTLPAGTQRRIMRDAGLTDADL